MIWQAVCEKNKYDSHREKINQQFKALIFKKKIWSMEIFLMCM